MSAILAWRNTPTEEFTTSTVQRLMGRRTLTLLLTSENLLQPNSNLKATAKNVAARKRYNRGTENLTPLKVGYTIRMRLPGEK